MNQSINRLINQKSIDQSTNRLINQPINRLINQSIDQSINRSINQSINRSINRLMHQPHSGSDVDPVGPLLRVEDLSTLAPFQQAGQATPLNTFAHLVTSHDWCRSLELQQVVCQTTGPMSLLHHHLITFKPYHVRYNHHHHYHLHRYRHHHDHHYHHHCHYHHHHHHNHYYYHHHHHHHPHHHNHHAIISIRFIVCTWLSATLSSSVGGKHHNPPHHH